MLLMETSRCTCTAPARPIWQVRQLSRQQCSRRTCQVRCQSADPDQVNLHLDRRSVLAAVTAAVTAGLVRGPAIAAGDTTTLYGLATPPTSYGGYGGNAKEAAKYIFDYPTGWKQDTVNKVEKGMQGIDSRVYNPKVGKSQGAFVVTFGRAGEDKKFSKLGDLDQTLQGFAGADYALQDALTEATTKQSNSVQKDGITFYDYEVAGNDLHYLVSVTLQGGKVYALFVKSPSRLFEAERPKLQAIVDSFKVL